MSINWTGLGPELLLRLDRARPEPLRDQLQRELREAIRSGQLGPGERLPSSRALARELGVSRGLVLECYAQLQAEGFLSAHAGAATRVAAGAQTPVAVQRMPTPAPRLAVDFRSGVPDLTSFPRNDWAWAMRESCRRASVAELDYGDPRGTIVLREILAAYLRRVRRAVVDPEQIIICVGFAQAINLVLQTLARSRVQRVGIEDPGDDDYRMIGKRVGIDTISVTVDERGIDVDALTAAACRAVILTPTHQFPTGVALAPERRQALVTWANQHDAVIVEDDYDAEFRYDREPVGALQGLAPNRVALLGTASKSLAPALRIGWVVCPPALLTTMIEEKALMDRGSPALEQLAARRPDRIRPLRPASAADANGLRPAPGDARPNARGTGAGRLAAWAGGGISCGRPAARVVGRASDRGAGARAIDRALRDEHVPRERSRATARTGARLRQPLRRCDRARHRTSQRPADGFQLLRPLTGTLKPRRIGSYRRAGSCLAWFGQITPNQRRRHDAHHSEPKRCHDPVAA